MGQERSLEYPKKIGFQPANLSSDEGDPLALFVLLLTQLVNPCGPIGVQQIKLLKGS
jgi:hypothetical protein